MKKSPVRRLGFDMLWFCGLGLFLLMATEYLIAVSTRGISQVSVLVPGKRTVIVRISTILIKVLPTSRTAINHPVIADFPKPTFHFRAHVICIGDKRPHRVKQIFFQFFSASGLNVPPVKITAIKKTNRLAVFSPILPDAFRLIIIIEIRSNLRQTVCLVKIQKLRIFLPNSASPAFNTFHHSKELNITLEFLRKL